MIPALLAVVALQVALPSETKAQVPEHLEALAAATAEVLIGRQIPARPSPLDSASSWESLLMTELIAADYPRYQDPFIWVKVRHSEAQLLVEEVAKVTVTDSVCTDRGNRGFLVEHTYMHFFAREAASWVHLSSKLRLSGSGDCEEK